jgi:hypothetical protein
VLEPTIHRTWGEQAYIYDYTSDVDQGF